MARVSEKAGLALVVLVPAFVVLGFALVASSAPPQPSGEARVMFPPDRAVILAGTFQVIVKGIDGDLKVDGRPHPWDPFAAPVRVARVGLLPGLHEIQIGNRKQTFVVGLSAEEHEGPREWPLVKFHSIKVDGNRCGDCHEMSLKEGKTTVGSLRGAKACFECHKLVEFEAIHSHPLEPIAHCEGCHALHGSSRKSLLKAPVKKLCGECHES